MFKSQPQPGLVVLQSARHVDTVLQQIKRTAYGYRIYIACRQGKIINDYRVSIDRDLAAIHGFTLVHEPTEGTTEGFGIHLF